MPNTTVPAAGEAVPAFNNVISANEIENARDLLSLLAVCTFIAQRIGAKDDDAIEISSDLARCLEWSRSLARQVRDDMVMAERIARK